MERKITNHQTGLSQTLKIKGETKQEREMWEGFPGVRLVQLLRLSPVGVCRTATVRNTGFFDSRSISCPKEVLKAFST